MPLKLIPKTTILPILQGELRGYQWITGSSAHGCWLGSYEFDKQELISKMVQQGYIAFDLGAHVGFYTLLFSKLVGTNGQVVAFEPFSDNIKLLKKHLQLNLVENAHVYEAAVADHGGVAYFELAENSTMGHISSIYHAKLQVKQVSIDELVFSGQLPAPDLIKLDIEGAELMALKGAMETLRKYHPIIFLATHSDVLHRDCCKLLLELEYNLKPIGAATLDQTDEILAI